MGSSDSALLESQAWASGQEGTRRGHSPQAPPHPFTSQEGHLSRSLQAPPPWKPHAPVLTLAAHHHSHCSGARLGQALLSGRAQNLAGK